MTMITLPEIRGEGPILLTVQAPEYDLETGKITKMTTTLRRRFEDTYKAQQYVAGVIDEGRGADLSFEIDPKPAKPMVLAIVERFELPQLAAV